MLLPSMLSTRLAELTLRRTSTLLELFAEFRSYFAVDTYSAVFTTLLSFLESPWASPLPVEHLNAVFLAASTVRPGPDHAFAATLFTVLQRLETDIKKAVLRKDPNQYPLQCLKAFLLISLRPYESQILTLTTVQLLSYQADALKEIFLAIDADKETHDPLRHLVESHRVCRETYAKGSGPRLGCGQPPLVVSGGAKYPYGTWIAEGHTTQRDTPPFSRPPPPFRCAPPQEENFRGGLLEAGLPPLVPSMVMAVDFDFLLIERSEDGANPDISDVMARACKGRLPPDQQRSLLHVFVQHPNSIFKCGLSPAKIPALVEANKEIGNAVLQRLCTTEYRDEFLAALTKADISEPSCDVVLRLVSSGVMPVSSLLAFISHGVKSLEGRAATDSKSVQHRATRVFAVLCHNLVISKVLKHSDVICELQHFCTANASVAEVAQLYGVIRKTLEASTKTRMATTST